MASIKHRLAVQSNKRDAMELRKLLEAARADIVTLATALDTLVAKLNADEGVTDTDYAGGNVSALTLEA